jgi:alginate O-acetyltransferase complex protein AlgI
MEIISIYFAVLSIISFFVYYLLNQKYRILFLTLLSCGFIASFSINLLIYVLIFSVINFFIGLKIPGSRFKKGLFRTGIVINLLQIIILKYDNFTISPILHLFNLSFGISELSKIIVPIGISYFTLQGIGYLINIHMGWEKPEKKVLNFILYIIFYPKFISGPIERSNHFLPQLKTFQSFSTENVTLGLRIALWGFFKKVIIANHLADTVTLTYSNSDTIGGLNVLLVILIQPLFLYFDFSGYTDIAIGFAKTFGIDLLPNFNRPFLSENMTTFWKRFHISLSSWFNDYVFKQASFKLRRWKSHATTIAVFITWILFGVWHGAGWNFMALGLMQGLAIYYEFVTKRKRITFFSKFSPIIRVWSGRIFTYCFYGISLTFFFAPDLTTAFKVFSKLKNISDFSSTNFLLKPFLFGLIFALLLLVYEILQSDYEKSYYRLQKYWTNHRLFRIVVYYATVVLIISLLRGNAAFVYEMF